MKGKRLTLSLRCEFTSEELDSKGQALSATMLRYDEVEEEKKAATATYREQLSDLRGEMRRLSKQIKTKGEDRPVECLAKFHSPNVGEKTIVRLDTGEVVRIEPMTDDERQENLFEEVDELERIYKLEKAADAQDDDVPPHQDATQGEFEPNDEDGEDTAQC